MPRYIDANMLRELIYDGFDIDFDEVPETKEALLNMIDYQKTVDVRENTHALWKHEIDTDSDMLKCSCCECRVIEPYYRLAVGSNGFNFCPYCGASMKG